MTIQSFWRIAEEKQNENSTKIILKQWDNWNSGVTKYSALDKMKSFKKYILRLYGLMQVYSKVPFVQSLALRRTYSSERKSNRL